MTRGQTPRSGRVPDFTGMFRVLPREPREVPAPAWPLPGDPSPREGELWLAAWRRPQAILWEEDDLGDDVALFVRKKAEAEQPGSSSAIVDTVRRLADDLLLTVPALRRAGVSIASPQEQAATAAPPRRSSSRDRFTVIPPASAGGPSAEDSGSPRYGSPTDSRGRHRSSRERFRQITPAVTRDGNPSPAA